MPVLNCIYCKAKKQTKAHIFAPFMCIESLLNGIISIFENLNIVEINIKKMDVY